MIAEKIRAGARWKAHLVGRECYGLIRIIGRKDCWNLSCSKQVSVVVKTLGELGRSWAALGAVCGLP